MKKAFLVDFENVKSAGLVGLEQLSAADEVVVLYSANSNTISFEMHQKILQSPACVDYYQIRRGGKTLWISSCPACWAICWAPGLTAICMW